VRPGEAISKRGWYVIFVHRERVRLLTGVEVSIPKVVSRRGH